jgi:hypothetical protein
LFEDYLFESGMKNEVHSSCASMLPGGRAVYAALLLLLGFLLEGVFTGLRSVL